MTLSFFGVGLHFYGSLDPHFLFLTIKEGNFFIKFVYLKNR